MIKPFPPLPDDTVVTGLPRTVAEAVNELVYKLSQAEKDELAAMPEEDLILLHFGFGAKIREDFGLWHENRALLADCQKAEIECRADVPEGLVLIHPDDASMLIIRALWGRLRH